MLKGGFPLNAEGCLPVTEVGKGHFFQKGTIIQTYRGRFKKKFFLVEAWNVVEVWNEIKLGNK